MTRHEEVQRLKELMAAPVDHTGCRAGNILRETLLAMPWLLAVAGQFQAGDMTILELFLQFMEHFKPDGHLNDTGPGKEITNAQAADCLRRMREAARMMEAEP